jgi:hypothetical protein
MVARWIAPLALLVGGCAASFATALTPSGEPCSDMPILSSEQKVDREYHRIGPVKSDLQCGTEAERLESLRRAACKKGADAIIEASNEEARLPDNSHVIRSSGTAVTWRHAPPKPTPLGTSSTTTPPPPAPATGSAPSAPPATAH